MKSSITREEAQAFKERWQAVNAAELEELRATSFEQKLRQLAALMASVKQMEWTAALAAEEDEARQRWLRLKRAYASNV